MDRNTTADMLKHLDLASNAKYLARADIANFFPSVYSHSLPWALVGREVAKQNREPALWYNKLDSHLRALKRAETQGVPIGPATSNIAAEIILAKIDKKLSDEGFHFVRFIDDYQCYCNTRDLADKFVLALEWELEKYLLKLNPRKVAICALPLPYRDNWINQLAIAAQSLPDRHSAGQLVGVLDYALHLQQLNPEGSVLKYAARMLINRLSQANADAFVRYLLHLANHYPVILPLICQAVASHDLACDSTIVQGILSRQIEYRHSDGMCWALYLI